MVATDTREMIMNAAKPMVQARGYSSLSFRDLAKEVGVKSASVHYHFPTKGDLGAALARRYTEDAIVLLGRLLVEDIDMKSAFKSYVDIFRSALVNENRMCLCGIMAAEYDELPAAVRVEVDGFTDANVNWLEKMLTKNDPKEKLQAIKDRAIAIFAAIEGAQLVARGRGDILTYDRCIDAYRRAGLVP